MSIHDHVCILFTSISIHDHVCILFTSISIHDHVCILFTSISIHDHVCILFTSMSIHDHVCIQCPKLRNLLMHTSGACPLKTMHPAKISAPCSMLHIKCSKKNMHVWVHGSKNPCTRQQNHAPRVQGAPLISDTDVYYSLPYPYMTMYVYYSLPCPYMNTYVLLYTSIYPYMNMYTSISIHHEHVCIILFPSISIHEHLRITIHFHIHILHTSIFCLAEINQDQIRAGVQAQPPSVGEPDRGQNSWKQWDTLPKQPPPADHHPTSNQWDPLLLDHMDSVHCGSNRPCLINSHVN